MVEFKVIREVHGALSKATFVAEGKLKDSEKIVQAIKDAEKKLKEEK